MTSRAPALSIGGAGLADGHRQWRQMQEGQPRGGTPSQAQSEREKRGSRHSDDGVASSSQPSGVVAPQTGQGDGSAPASKIAEVWGPTSEAVGPGAGLPMPSAQALSIQQLQSKQQDSTR